MISPCVIGSLGNREEGFGLMIRNPKQVIVENIYGLNWVRRRTSTWLEGVISMTVEVIAVMRVNEKEGMKEP